MGVVAVGAGGDVDPVDAPDVAGPWKSTIGSVRITRDPALTTSESAEIVYLTPSLSATKVSSPERVAVVISLAPSRTRTPRYCKAPPEDSQMAIREPLVLPKARASAGAAQRAVESR